MYRVQVTEYRVQSPEYRAHCAEYDAQSTEYRVQSTEYQFSGFRSRETCQSTYYVIALKDTACPTCPTPMTLLMRPFSKDWSAASVQCTWDRILRGISSCILVILVC